MSHKDGAGTQNKSILSIFGMPDLVCYLHCFQLGDKNNRVLLAEYTEQNGRLGLLIEIFRSASTKPVCLRSDIDAIVIWTEWLWVQSLKDSTNCFSMQRHSAVRNNSCMGAHAVAIRDQHQTEQSNKSPVIKFRDCSRPVGPTCQCHLLNTILLFCVV